MKNSELEKRYSGDDLKQAKMTRNRIKRGKVIRWIADGYVGDDEHPKYAKPSKQMCTIDAMVQARNIE